MEAARYDTEPDESSSSNVCITTVPLAVFNVIPGTISC